MVDAGRPKMFPRLHHEHKSAGHGTAVKSILGLALLRAITQGKCSEWSCHAIELEKKVIESRRGIHNKIERRKSA